MSHIPLIKGTRDIRGGTTSIFYLYLQEVKTVYEVYRLDHEGTTACMSVRVSHPCSVRADWLTLE